MSDTCSVCGGSTLYTGVVADGDGGVMHMIEGHCIGNLTLQLKESQAQAGVLRSLLEEIRRQWLYYYPCENQVETDNLEALDKRIKAALATDAGAQAMREREALVSEIDHLHNFLRFGWQNSEDRGPFCNFCNGIGDTYSTVNHAYDCILWRLPENKRPEPLVGAPQEREEEVYG